MRKDTKAWNFDEKTKIAIAQRDGVDGWPCCIYCGKPAPLYEDELIPLTWSNAHFISRAQGGRGVERNGLTLCPKCHRRYDQSTDREEMRDFFREYLQDQYEDWVEEELIYRKEQHGR